MCESGLMRTNGRSVAPAIPGKALLIVQDWKKIGDPILHIELRRWADMVVVAPCSADILAKIAGGLSENLPVSTVSLRFCPVSDFFSYRFCGPWTGTRRSSYAPP